MKKVLSYIYDVLLYILGSALAAIGVNFFLAANEISPGGFAGIATTLNYIFGIPAGFILFIFNVPLLIIGYKKLGGVFILKTAVVATFFSLTLDISARLLPIILMDKIIAAVFGGMLLGLGMSLVMLRGATTGGVDIIAKLVNKRYPHLSIGRTILLFDGFVVLLAALAYKNIESALYSVIAMYACTKIIDIMLYGSDMGKIIYAVTDRYQEVSEAVGERMRRGVTWIPATGSYSKHAKIMIICAVRRHEVAAVRSIIREYDKSAFIVIADAGEIIGEGFKIEP